MSKKQPKAKVEEPNEFSDYVDAAIENFETAARNFALLGGQHPLERPTIETQYVATKAALRQTIVEYVRRRVRGLEEGEV